MRMKVMRGFVKGVVFGVGLVASADAPGAAQSIQSSYRFLDHSQSGGVFAGYIFTSPGPAELGPKSGPAGGLRYTIRLSGPFDVEGDALFFPTTRTVRDTVVTADSTRLAVGTADQAMAVFNVALRFNLTGPRTWRRLQPFVAFGVGTAVNFTGSGEADEDVPSDARYKFGTSFAGQLGGGVEWFATDRLAVRFDARNVLWKIKTPPAFLIGQFGQRTPAEEWVQNGLLSIGLALHF